VKKIDVLGTLAEWFNIPQTTPERNRQKVCQPDQQESSSNPDCQKRSEFILVPVIPEIISIQRELTFLCLMISRRVSKMSPQYFKNRY